MSSIHIQNLSISFKTYHDRSPSLKGFFAEIRKRKNTPSYTDYLAVNNVSFDVKSGERVGIIGRNGAGKSTLLKALCRVYETADGIMSIEGNIAPLLEIGAGFHPEYTGRENIYLNGSILGFSKKKLQEIEPGVVAFAELEEFIDTPVKYYSTGMFMRLAFSLATAMKPDILVLDEVFAGGDADFIVKAKARMYNMIDEANIMLMVSHDSVLVESLCNRVIWLDHGKIIADGAPEEIVEKYLKDERPIHTK